ncbi:MAG: glycosyltransferase [Aliifodinibius sp.]|nr:glycosyltransferase [Fodinibius sp.]NIY27244.1 glycosyltransferase [Fodinibius sp.]
MVRAISRRLADEMPEVRLVSFGGTGTDLPPKMEQRGKISQQHAAELYANSSVFLEASESQGFGLQGLETMGSGSVLVSTKNRGIDNYGKHEKNCLLIDVNDSDAAFNAIKRALNDEDLRKKLIANGRKTALDHDWWRIAEKHADFYGRVLRDEI